MKTERISLLTTTVILLQATLVLVSFSRGDCGSALVIAMCPFVAVALVPSALAFCGPLSPLPTTRPGSGCSSSRA
jgi:hypothetical protein